MFVCPVWMRKFFICFRFGCRLPTQEFGLGLFTLSKTSPVKRSPVRSLLLLLNFITLVVSSSVFKNSSTKFLRAATQPSPGARRSRSGNPRAGAASPEINASHSTASDNPELTPKAGFLVWPEDCSRETLFSARPAAELCTTADGSLRALLPAHVSAARQS